MLNDNWRQRQIAIVQNRLFRPWLAMIVFVGVSEVGSLSDSCGCVLTADMNEVGAVLDVDVVEL